MYTLSIILLITDYFIATIAALYLLIDKKECKDECIGLTKSVELRVTAGVYFLQQISTAGLGYLMFAIGEYKYTMVYPLFFLVNVMMGFYMLYMLLKVEDIFKYVVRVTVFTSGRVNLISSYMFTSIIFIAGNISIVSLVSLSIYTLTHAFLYLLS